MVLAVIDGAVRWVVYFLIWASLPGFEEVHRKTAPDTEPETHLAMLVECLPGARGQGPEQRWIPTACIVSTPFPQNVGCRSSGARCVLQTQGRLGVSPNTGGQQKRHTRSFTNTSRDLSEKSFSVHSSGGFFFFCHAACGSLVPRPRIEPRPSAVLPRNSLEALFRLLPSTASCRRGAACSRGELEKTRAPGSRDATPNPAQWRERERGREAGWGGGTHV